MRQAGRESTSSWRCTPEMEPRSVARRAQPIVRAHPQGRVVPGRSTELDAQLHQVARADVEGHGVSLDGGLVEGVAAQILDDGADGVSHAMELGLRART